MIIKKELAHFSPEVGEVGHPLGRSEPQVPGYTNIHMTLEKSIKFPYILINYTPHLNISEHISIFTELQFISK